MIELELVRRVIEPLAGFVIMVCCVLSWTAMSGATRHCYRFAYGVLGVAGLALMLDPLFKEDFAPWTRLIILIGFALYMVLDRRRIRPTRDAPSDSSPFMTPLLAAMSLGAVLLLLMHAPTQAQDPAPQVTIQCAGGFCVIPEAIADRLIEQSNRALELSRRCPPGTRL